MITHIRIYIHRHTHAYIHLCTTAGKYTEAEEHLINATGACQFFSQASNSLVCMHVCTYVRMYLLVCCIVMLCIALYCVCMFDKYDEAFQFFSQASNSLLCMYVCMYVCMCVCICWYI